MMQGEAAASYDVVFAADVFVYLGKLDELVERGKEAAAAGRTLCVLGRVARRVDRRRAALPDRETTS